jgi:uncharacterized protein YjdB
MIIVGVMTANAQYYMDVYYYDGNKQTIPVSSVKEIKFWSEITATGITLNKSSIKMISGTNQELIATVLPDSATYKDVIWTSSDTTIAVVENGLVKAIREGEATIKATTHYGNKSATCKVVVSDNILEYISVRYTGGSAMILNGVYQNGSTMNWFIYNNSPVDITLTGLQLYDNQTGTLGSLMSLSDLELQAGNNTGWTVTVGAAGIRDPYVVIRFRYNGADYFVTASPSLNDLHSIPVQSISFDYSYKELQSGDKITLIPRFTPSVSYSSVSWTSDNPEVATVDKSGNVEALSKGKAIITAKINDDISTNCTILVDSIMQVIYEYVDLGLSVNWATFNVGATVPEELGNHYAWGETEPKSDFSISTYKYCNGADRTFTKYCNNSYYGTVDNKTLLESEDDVAHVQLGGNWRMPQKEEFEELNKNCTWTWTTINGIKGFQVKSNKPGYRDRSIFIPAAGYREGTSVNSEGTNGYYNTMSLNSSNNSQIYEFSISSYSHDVNSSGSRVHGHSVRPVCPSETWNKGISVSIDNDSLNIIFSRTEPINAVVKNGTEDVSYLLGKDVVWSSSNPEVVSVDEKGIVTGISIGVATVIASYNDLSDTCIVAVLEPEYEYVDLGLSVNWATFNVGTSLPEKSVYYYAWGETEPKSEYSWGTYKYCEGSSSTITKYNNTDNKTILDPEDDVAHVLWGDNWRMPTETEFMELCDPENCTWTWTSLNGEQGYMITSIKVGYRGRSIFIPAGGYKSGAATSSVGSYGYYNSSTLYTGAVENQMGLKISKYGGIVKNRGNREHGYTVRPVSEKQFVEMTNIQMMSDSLYLPENYEQYIDISIIPQNATAKPINWFSSDTTIATVDNRGLIRTVSEGRCIITAQTNDSLISAKCVVEVFGIYTYHVILPPDNEIWYTSADGNVINMNSYPATLTSNSYENGKGVYKFNSSVNSIGSNFGDKSYLFTSITFPTTVKGVTSYRALAGLRKAHSIILPPSVTSIGTDVFGSMGDDLEEGTVKHIYFLSQTSPTCDWRPFWNLSGAVWVHYPEGSDYSQIEKEVKEWGDLSGMKWRMVETRYIITD